MRDEEKTKSLIEVLETIIQVPYDGECVDDNTLMEFYQKLAALYQDDFRHLYSLLSKFLEKQSPDVYSSLTDWIASILDYGRTQYPQNNTENKAIEKLYDHIELESIRIDRMKAVQYTTRENERLSSEIRVIADQAMNGARKAEENVQHFHEQSVAILSIFSAVVLSFMGGISFAGKVLDNLDKVSFFVCPSRFYCWDLFCLIRFLYC